LVYNGEKPPILLFSYPFWKKQVMLPFSEPYFAAHYRCSDTTAKTRADIKAAAIMNAVEALFQNIGSFEMADLAAEVKKKDTEGQVKG